MNGYAISKTLHALEKWLKGLLAGQYQIDLKGKPGPREAGHVEMTGRE